MKREITVQYLSEMMQDYLEESKSQAKYGILDKDVYSGIKQTVEHFQSLVTEQSGEKK